VADVRSYVEGRFVIIVGDMELAEELRVGHATVAEVICLTDSKCNNFESADVTTELAGVLADNLTKLHQGRKPSTSHRHVAPLSFQRGVYGCDRHKNVYTTNKNTTALVSLI